tara:strand:+ start:348 stop:455 length:108 start_codon:yes stop_codon:yes gene_type:complete
MQDKKMNIPDPVKGVLAIKENPGQGFISKPNENEK